MEGYVSRAYLREKYNRIKGDMEGCLDVLNTDAGDRIEPAVAAACMRNIFDNAIAIVTELDKANK